MRFARRRATASVERMVAGGRRVEVIVCGSFGVSRIMKAAAAPEGTPWLWTLAFGHHEDRTPTHGYAATREAAMAAFAKSWRRE
jgi:hypothetical protein